MLVFEHGQQYGIRSFEASPLRTASLRPELMMTINTNPTAALSAEALPDLDTIRRRRTPACRFATNSCGQPPGPPGRAADPHYLILEHLRALRLDVAALRKDVRDARSGLGILGISLVTRRVELARQGESIATVSARLDRIEQRLGFAE